MPGGTEIRFEGATAMLRGRVDRPARGTPLAALVIAHGRHEHMDGPLLAALAERATDLGLWTLRFNFAFREGGTEPSAGHADEIADLREAIGYARKAAGTDIVYVAGRGLGAWAAVAAATDEITSGAVLLGLSYVGQPERKMALERLGEFEIPTLVLVGSESERVDLPALHAVLRDMHEVNLEVIEGGDHRLQDAKGHPLTETVLMKCEAWLRIRLG
jgi:hypothetical protein